MVVFTIKFYHTFSPTSRSGTLNLLTQTDNKLIQSIYLIDITDYFTPYNACIVITSKLGILVGSCIQKSLFVVEGLDTYCTQLISVYQELFSYSTVYL